MVTLFAKNDRLAPSCQHNLFEHRLALEILQSVNMVDFVACAICTATELALFSHEPTFKRTTCFNRLRYGVRYFILCGFCSFAVLILGKVAKITEKALANIRTMGVATSPCIVPEVGKATFGIEDNKIEVGMGIHGEPGIEVRDMMTADEIADTLTERILADMPLKAGDEVSILINSLGATPLEEQLIDYRRAHKILSDIGVRVFMPHVGEFATSMEMAGLSLTMFKLDGQLKELLCYDAQTPFYTNYNK